jgi:hypothetical protein
MASLDEASELFSSDLLVEVAPLACKEIMDCAIQGKPSSIGSRIGTILHLIAGHLEVMQLF